MFKYFSNCQNLSDLKSQYKKLLRKYHPDLATGKSEFEQLNKTCAEINDEYNIIIKRFPENKVEEERKNVNIYNYVINSDDEARNACDVIADNIAKLQIDYNFYYTFGRAKWWEDQVLLEISNSIRFFWNICVEKKIVGKVFARLFELCDFNVEKMRRTIMFLSTCAIAEKDIHTNLTASNSIPFFDDYITVENLPDYNSFLLLSKEITKKETIEAWIEFCQRQRDNFYEKFYDIVIPKFSSERQK